MASNPLDNSPYVRVRDLIVRGRLALGVPLIESEVGARLGLSRTPVRDALRRLRDEGLAEAVGGGERPRLAVSRLSLSEADETFRAAGALEGVAARRIATRSPSVRLALGAGLAVASEAYQRLVAERTDRAVGPSAIEPLIAGGMAFHRRLREGSAGQRTQSLLDALDLHVVRYEWFVASRGAYEYGALIAAQVIVVRAVREGSDDDIERAVRALWLERGARIANVITRTEIAELTGSGWDSVSSVGSLVPVTGRRPP